jgi:REP element-mobilizing transposase RayT
MEGIAMPRKPRLFIPYATYHVYCRVARGEFVFANREDSDLFLETLRETRDRDGLSILAWCLMTNHYHIVVKTGSVPLWRTMARLQRTVAREHNRRRRVIVDATCALAGVQLADLRSRKRRSEIANVRWDLAAIAVGRYGHRICDLAAILNKNPGSVSRWLTEADGRQATDADYRSHLDHLESRVVERALQNITM